MRNYQLIIVLRTGLSDSEKKKITESLKDWLKNVKIVKEEQWGEKPLSYKIKKETVGFFLNYYLETEEVIPQDFEKRLFGHEDVLRHLLLKVKSQKLKVKSEDGQKAKVEGKKETKAKVSKARTKRK